jgi:23S rRNA pseudouridine2605 synthase
MAWTSMPSADPGQTAISLLAKKHGIARTVSKLGLGSRNTAADWVRAGRITVNGRVVRDPEFPVRMDRDQLCLDGKPLLAAEKRYLMLNKPRGLVTTTADEQGRDTVYRCFENAQLPWLAPVGRLDKASEGLLLFSNDPEWAARITDPATGADKTYHVQVNVQADAALLAKLVTGINADGERLAAKSARLIRSGEKNAWLEIVLDEGRNRHIRRLLEAHGIRVLRLIRIAIGPLQLGTLAKGQWRWLEPHEYR